MASQGPYTTPSKVTPIEGEVVIDGPDGVAVSVTPDAAETTAARLWDAANTARGQPPGDDDS
jgi:hypothetical protein